jgi:glucose-6-phosphate isomerase
MLGWLDLPIAPADELQKISDCAERLRDELEALVVVGIGGSYLGTRAVLDALAPASGLELHFAGHHLEASAYDRLLRQLRGRRWGIQVISKSGTTTEPAIAFRLLRSALESEVGAATARRRIVVTTDAQRGALREMVRRDGYESFVVPDDVGGRFSVFSPVGLLPLAVAGVDPAALLAGAARLRTLCLGAEADLSWPVQYAALRHALAQNAIAVEILASFQPSLAQVAEWWKQLFGESEGKGGQGLFPASLIYTTDLHSLGQYVQDGRRMLLETFLVVEAATAGTSVPAAPDDLDGLGYLEGRSLAEINRLAFDAVADAHAAGGVAVLSLHLPRLDTVCLGELLFGFEFAVAVSARLLGVNPFDQPGVEAYKQRLFAILAKPGA